ncbi:sigma-54 dependent transcriptional regulator [Sporomusa sp.]|uniref:sigma-54-dependent transcriptional regulator n=1 Tax=Sporomusa sp. TaxID=2078658 RepID=UPI002D12318A|nr:sigma-54 dependent transcriptional regulator [Sporomusa sp.]HWR41785.1 sigma-54 dependent transcriptional regulator [Sporomusa sp.]
MRILLVDDDVEGRSFLANYLVLLGHAITQCQSGEEALATYNNNVFEMILSDIKMDGISGIELVRESKKIKHEPAADVVLYTGFVDLELAIGALRAGAYDYLTKPINMDELKAILERVEEHQALLQKNEVLAKHFDEDVKVVMQDKHELAELQQKVATQAGIGKIGIFSDVIKRVVRQAEQYHTDRSLPVLIQGETGVGKEIIAKIIHYGEKLESGPFIDINCTAITPSLFESELFGYEAGSFTGGSTRGQKGKLDMAMGGTLFLDEIAEIPIELQAKLLRVIEEKSFYRVGGLKKIKTDIRIIAATNLDFEKRIAEGLFRKDLYYRLKVGQIIIPPLRQRKDDILPLARMFLQDFSERRGKQFRNISESAARLLLSYNWPGNIRELRNAMEWVSFMYDGTELKEEHLGNLAGKAIVPDIKEKESRGEWQKATDVPEAFALGDHIDELIEQALRRFGGNKTQAARSLGISVRALYYRLERLQKRRANGD